MTYSEEIRDLLEPWVYPSVLDDVAKELEALYVKHLTESTIEAVLHFFEVEKQEEKLTEVRPD